MSIEPRPPVAADAPTPGAGGKRRASRSGRPMPRRRAPKRRHGALVLLMAAALLLCGGFTVVRPMVTGDDVQSVASRSAGSVGSAARSATAELDAATAKRFPPPEPATSKHPQKEAASTKAPSRKAASPAVAAGAPAASSSTAHAGGLLNATLTRLNSFDGSQPMLLLPSVQAAIQARADREAARLARLARLRNGPFDVKIAYYNMLGCYHTDRDEPNYGHLARHFASCSTRMPRQFDYLTEHGISIAGVGEFQGKAWRVLAEYGRHQPAWGIFPAGQSGPFGQNPVVWRKSEWRFVRGGKIVIPYNCANGGRCVGSSSMVLLENVKHKRKIFVLSTHHTSDGGGGGAARRSGAFNVELSRIAKARASGVPIVYMGDFNSVSGPISRLSGSMVPAFTSGVGIDQIWGTPGLSFADTRYDTNFRRMGLTDHGSGIAITTLTMPALEKAAANARKR